jgi:multisubunit Na+/H+ antiporter MnhB subunit
VSNQSHEISRQERANALGLAFLRAILILNGGGILALLTFLGNASAQTVVTIPLVTIKLAMLCFLIAIAVMMLGLLFSYSFTAMPPESKFVEFWNRHIVKLNFYSGVVSLTAFIVSVSILLVGSSEAMP